jgi:SAM-dependent methyltransferase
MKLIDLFEKKPKRRKYWDGKYKIPWDEPGFSKRMLREHLTQDHNRASRRLEIIDQHVDWIHNEVLCGKPSRILDLGCGPGFYTRKLAALGHKCVGIDFGPAVMDYAVRYAPGDGSCTYTLGDIRTEEYGDGFDLIMMIFGEFNAFSKNEAETILTKAHASLRPGGQLLVEAHTFETVRRIGMTPGSWYRASGSLFSDKPHICLIENVWDEKARVATSEFVVIDAATSEVERYRNTLQAYTSDGYSSILKSAGFSRHGLAPVWGKDELGPNDEFVMLRANRD